MARRLSSAIMVTLVAALLQTTVAQKVHVVGDTLGWLVPPDGPIAYAAWAAMQTFSPGDILVFNFTTGQQDVARVSKEAFDTCNSTNPILLETNGPVNFTLSSGGEYYFIGTMEMHCPLGQKLAMYVPPPAPPRAPMTYEVGDGLGWLVPPGGAIAYATWAFNKTFIVGDTLVFNFVNGTQDVAVVTKAAYESCDTTTTTRTVLTTTPAKITLSNPGEHYFTSTYPLHCNWGQQLAINVIASSTAMSPSTSAASPPSTTTKSSSVFAPAAGGPIPPPTSSAPSHIVIGFFYVTFLSSATTFLL
ncbi:blue copper protein-like [Camellia sinensis]|uniref:blue copper protein-like n=1 Tax=Camellia sinensis TaxID=4442 RepID=UPI001036B7CD|nr:blue copper protein-like [Camellia sinensis]